jgi:CheY-like chemotaxis protein
MSPERSFAGHVRDALLHLYDSAHLQEHPLVRMLVDNGPVGSVSNAQALRRVLLATIEELRPAPHVPYSAREWRPYKVLHLRYVQRLSTPVILDELAISDRQYQREHARAMRAVTALLRRRAAPRNGLQTASAAPAEGNETVDEVRRLVAGAQPEPLDGRELAESVLSAVQGLADRHHVEVHLGDASALPAIYADRGLVRQVMINLLGYLLAGREGGRLYIRPARDGGEAEFAFSLSDTVERGTDEASPGTCRRLVLGQELAQAVGGRVIVKGRCAVALRLPLRQVSLLVVDDNRDVIELFKRYLGDTPYAVVGADTARDALAMARDVRPMLITIDVMMPTHDGWELLQQLKHNPETCDIPVAVCSILEEPELAHSLGADDYLKKPVAQEALLALLGRWSRGACGGAGQGC